MSDRDKSNNVASPSYDSSILSLKYFGIRTFYSQGAIFLKIDLAQFSS